MSRTSSDAVQGKPKSPGSAPGNVRAFAQDRFVDRHVGPDAREIG